MAAPKQQPLNYKSIALQAGITALVFAAVNHFITPKKGLSAPIRLMLNLPLERMSQFADAVTIANVNNLSWLQSNIDKFDVNDPGSYQNVNQTSLGNCAFVALYSKYDQYREKCLVMLENAKKYLG